MQSLQEIKHYLLSGSRNKLVIHKKPYDDIKYCDIGKELADYLKDNAPWKKIGLKSNFYLDELLTRHLKSEEEIGSYLAIKNIGILLEPELKIDLSQFLERHSKSNALLLHWNGHIEKDTLYHLTKEKGIKIILNGLSHIII